MRALILAAGRGTRLGRLTEATPKPLLSAAGRPLLEWIILNLARGGIRRIAVNLSYHGEVIAAWLGDGRRLGLEEVVLSRETQPLGTAGALRPLAGWLGQGPFLIHYGDVVTDHDLTALETDRQRHGALATLLMHRRSGSNSILECDADGRVTRFRERPPATDIARAGECWVNSGVCACDPGILNLVPASGEPDLARDVLAPLAGSGRLRGQPLSGQRVAVDSPERLERLDKALRTNRLRPAGTAIAFRSDPQHDV